LYFFGRTNVGNAIFIDAIKQFVNHVHSRSEAGYQIVAEGGFAEGLEAARINRQQSLRKSKKTVRRTSSTSTSSSLEVDNSKTIHELVRSQISLQETIGQGQYGVVRKAE
jgi:hypothetical protein